MANAWDIFGIIDRVDPSNWHNLKDLLQEHFANASTEDENEAYKIPIDTNGDLWKYDGEKQKVTIKCYSVTGIDEFLKTLAENPGNMYVNKNLLDDDEFVAFLLVRYSNAFHTEEVLLTASKEEEQGYLEILPSGPSII